MIAKRYNLTIVLGALILAVAGTITVRNLIFRSEAVLTDGVVIKMALGRIGAKRNQTPIVSYLSQDGQPHTYRSNTYVPWPFSYQTDEKVKIYYDPKNPDDAQIKDNMFWAIFFIVIGGCLFGECMVISII